MSQISLRIISQPVEYDNGDYIRAMHTANKVVLLMLQIFTFTV
jgi:hypothetical protein